MFIHYWLSRWISCGKSAVDFDRTFLTYNTVRAVQKWLNIAPFSPLL
ncbi:hypothetical protein [Aggregatibacter actinomycetemcomitans]|nr:hypothetical protein [Aggregatibacter actinomycetemcomitans]